MPGPAFGLSRTLFIYFVSSEEEVHPYLPYPPHTQPRLRCRQPWLDVQLKKSIRPVPWAHRHLLEQVSGSWRITWHHVAWFSFPGARAAYSGSEDAISVYVWAGRSDADVLFWPRRCAHIGSTLPHRFVSKQKRTEYSQNGDSPTTSCTKNDRY